MNALNNNDPHLLVIEDEPAVMAFVCRALERGGYKVVGAVSGEEGVKALSEASFHGIVSDMRTPGSIDGAGVYRWLAANQPRMCKRIVFITGDIVNSGTRALLHETGAPCVEKPFRIQDLLAVVEKTFGRAAE